MKEDSVLDYMGEVNEVEISLKKAQKILMVLVACMVVFNSAMFIYLSSEDPSDDDLQVLATFSIFYILLGFVIGTITALFPYKGLEYSRKYFRAALLSIFVMQIILAALLFFVWITDGHKSTVVVH